MPWLPAGPIKRQLLQTSGKMTLRDSFHRLRNLEQLPVSLAVIAASIAV
jgi:hypothetical protein